MVLSTMVLPTKPIALSATKKRCGAPHTLVLSSSKDYWNVAAPYTDAMEDVEKKKLKSSPGDRPENSRCDLNVGFMPNFGRERRRVVAKKKLSGKE